MAIQPQTKIFGLPENEDRLLCVMQIVSIQQASELGPPTNSTDPVTFPIGVFKGWAPGRGPTKGLQADRSGIAGGVGFYIASSYNVRATQQVFPGQQLPSQTPTPWPSPTFPPVTQQSLNPVPANLTINWQLYAGVNGPTFDDTKGTTCECSCIWDPTPCASATTYLGNAQGVSSIDATGGIFSVTGVVADAWLLCASTAGDNGATAGTWTLSTQVMLRRCPFVVSASGPTVTVGSAIK